MRAQCFLIILCVSVTQADLARALTFTDVTVSAGVDYVQHQLPDEPTMQTY